MLDIAGCAQATKARHQSDVCGRATAWFGMRTRIARIAENLPAALPTTGKESASATQPAAIRNDVAGRTREYRGADRGGIVLVVCGGVWWDYFTFS